MRLGLREQTLLFEIGDYPLTRLETVQIPVTRRRLVVGPRVDGEDVDLRQTVTLADDVVVEIMRGRYFQRAASECRIHVLVGNDGYSPIRERQIHFPADEAAVALVVRMHGHRGVAEHGLGSRGCHHHVAFTVGDGIADVPQVAVLLLRDHLEVRDRRVQHGVPVDQALAAIDQAFFVQAHECFAHRPRETLVHREALRGPVHRRAHASKLPRDGASGVLLPVPYPAQERLAADVVPRDALGVELALDHDLSGDTGVIGARLPERVCAPHAVVADQGIHDRVLERVAHVQAAGDVGRRDHDAVGLALAARREVAVLLPGLVPGLLDGLRVVGFIHTWLERI